MARARTQRSRGRHALRWIVPLLLSLPLAIVVLGLGACLPVALGDPETSRVDPRLAGVWTDAGVEPMKDVLVLLPFDSRTYVLLAAEKTSDNEGHTHFAVRGQYKAWLTTIKEQTFISLEPLYLREALEPKDAMPGYIVARISLSEDGNRVEALSIDPDFPALAPLKALPGHIKYERPEAGEPAPEALSPKEARALLERVVTENIDNEHLYDTTVYRRVTDKAILRALFPDVVER